MKYIYLIFILLVVKVSARPSGHCELSSHLCIEKDFLPAQDARNCSIEDVDKIPVNATYKTCGAFERCYKQADDFDGVIYCNEVSDANPTNHGPIETACKQWKQSYFCELDTSLIVWLAIAVIVGAGVVAFLIYYFVSNAAKNNKKMMPAAASKGKYKRLKNKSGRLYKIEP